VDNESIASSVPQSNATNFRENVRSIGLGIEEEVKNAFLEAQAQNQRKNKTKESVHFVHDKKDPLSNQRKKIKKENKKSIQLKGY